MRAKESVLILMSTWEVSLYQVFIRLWVVLALMFTGCGGDAPVTPDEATVTAAQPAPTAVATTRELPSLTPLKGDGLRVPFILWGGDMATFYGNGGLRTTEGSIFAKQGLILDLVPGMTLVSKLPTISLGPRHFYGEPFE